MAAFPASPCGSMSPSILQGGLCPTVAGRHGGTGNAEALSCRLRYTHLTSACCQDLSVALGTSTCLEELDLSFSARLRDDGVTLLCEGLQHSSCQLQVLR